MGLWTNLMRLTRVHTRIFITHTHTHTHTHARTHTFVRVTFFVYCVPHFPIMSCTFFVTHFTLISCSFLLNSVYSMLTGEMRSQRSSDPNKKTCPKLLPNAFANRATVLEVETPHFSFSFDPKMKRSKNTILLTGRRI